MNKQAFTLVEIIVSIVIIGVLAGLALPRYQQTLEIRQANAAEEQLRLIANTVQMLVDSRTIPDCSANCCQPSVGTCLKTINDQFDMDIHDPDFDYTVACAPGSSAWTVDAARADGAYTLTIDSGTPDTVTCSGSCAYIKR